jgi:hypothetical protein
MFSAFHRPTARHASSRGRSTLALGCVKLSRQTRRSLKATGWGLLLALVTVGPIVGPYLLEPTDGLTCRAVRVVGFRYGLRGTQYFEVASVDSGYVREVGAANTPFGHDYRGEATLAFRFGRWTGRDHVRLYSSCPAPFA